MHTRNVLYHPSIQANDVSVIPIYYGSEVAIRHETPYLMYNSVQSTCKCCRPDHRRQNSGLCPPLSYTCIPVHPVFSVFLKLGQTVDMPTFHNWCLCKTIYCTMTWCAYSRDSVFAELLTSGIAESRYTGRKHTHTCTSSGVHGSWLFGTLSISYSVQFVPQQW